MSVVLLGTWKSGVEFFKDLVIGEEIYHLDGKKGRWKVIKDELWLLNDDTRAGTKWHFKVVGNDVLVLSCPEDFKYLGGSNYYYFQMTPPSTVVTFHKVD